MKAPAHRLIETAWPEFPAAAEPPVAAVEEFQSRIDRLRARMEEQRLSHLVVYGDREHFANLAYLTNFDPRFEEALLVVGPDTRPLLIVGNECEAYLPISPLFKSGGLRTERFQPFSLLDQPRNGSRSLEEIFRDEKIVAASVSVAWAGSTMATRTRWTCPHTSSMCCAALLDSTT